MGVFVFYMPMKAMQCAWNKNNLSASIEWLETQSSTTFEINNSQLK